MAFLKHFLIFAMCAAAPASHSVQNGNGTIEGIVVSLLASTRPQIDTPLVPPEQDQRDLFARATASRVVIIGTVVKTEGKFETISPEAILERLHQGKDYRAVLYTINVDEIVCQQSDFDGNAPSMTGEPKPFYLLSPLDESNLPNGSFREELLPDKRYLLLLTDHDSASLSKTYKLDPNRIYYRGEENNRGVIPLDPDASHGKTQNPPEVVDKFRKLCDAMHPLRFEDKLALLQKLAESGDPILQKEAEIAKGAIKARMAHQESTPKSQ
jgi:hypothetical protein